MDTAATETDIGPDPSTLIAEACHEPLASAWEEIQHEIRDQVLRPLETAVAGHREVVSTIGLAGEPPPKWLERSDKLLEYRRVVGADVLEPLVAALEDGGPAQTIAERLEAALAHCSEAARALPATVSEPWPEGALAPRDGEGLNRRLRKLLARALGGVRRAGHTRELPLRALALAHLHEVVAPGQDVVAADVLRSWAEWAQRLERAWTEWGTVAPWSLVRSELLTEEAAHEPWAEVRAAAETLQSRLEALLSEPPSPLEYARAELDTSRTTLATDLAVAGGFVYRPADPTTPRPRTPLLTRSVPEHVAWNEGVAARMSMYVALLSILAGATAVQRRLVWRFRERCLARVHELSGIASALEELAAIEVERPSLSQRLDDLARRMHAALEPAKETIPEPALVDSIVRDGSDAAVEALLSMVRQAPVILALHEEAARVPGPGRRVETRPLAFQDLARQSFDALRIERIRSSTLGLVSAIDQSRKDLSALPEALSFAHEAAVAELEKGAEGAEERARELLGQGLRSVAESLRLEVADLESAVAQAQARLASEIGDGSQALLERLGAGSVQARLLAARSGAANLRAWLSESLGPTFRNGSRGVSRRLVRARLLAARELRRGRAFVSGTSVGEGSSLRSIRSLASAQSLIEGLPLVYQRLFTLDPVAEPVLLAGRARELADVVARWSRWRSEDAVPIVVRGGHGCGITSFLNVLASRLQDEGARVLALTLEKRITDERTLACLLATRLNLPTGGSVDEIASEIFAASPSALPDAIILDNLEHLYLRVPGGTELIERLLTLMAETEPRVFWIGGVTASAWQLVSAAEPTAVSQVDLLDLRPLDAEALRAAVQARHRRSGLHVRFEEPRTGHHMLRRRLRRMRDPAAYHRLLEDDFFERLHKTSSGHLRLALFHWLASSDFESGEGVLIGQPERPDFTLLDSLDLTQNFTLKAFLEHRTLTLVEHDRIFRLSRQESYQIFESLQNRRLIEAVGAPSDESPHRSEIQEDLRYQVRPLLVGGVVAHLRSRNIVH